MQALEAWHLVQKLAQEMDNGSSNGEWDLVHKLAQPNGSSNGAWNLVLELAHCDNQSSNEGSKRSEQASDGQSSSNGGSRINIWIKHDWNDKQPKRGLCFFMNKHDPLSALMNTYCNDYGLERKNMRFLFGGSVIFETQTPNDLNMKNGVIIRALRCEAYEDDKSATKSNGGSQNSKRNNDPATSDCFITGVSHIDDPVASIDLCDDEKHKFSSKRCKKAQS